MAAPYGVAQHYGLVAEHLDGSAVQFNYPSPRVRDLIVAQAGAGLYVTGLASSLRTGVEMALHAIDEGDETRDPAGLTPAQQLTEVAKRSASLVRDLYALVLNELLPALEKSRDILGELLASLDFARGGAIARQLSSIYVFQLGQLQTMGIAPDVRMLERLTDRKSTRLNSSHMSESRMPSSA